MNCKAFHGLQLPIYYEECGDNGPPPPPPSQLVLKLNHVHSSTTMNNTSILDYIPIQRKGGLQNKLVSCIYNIKMYSGLLVCSRGSTQLIPPSWLDREISKRLFCKGGLVLDLSNTSQKERGGKCARNPSIVILNLHQGLHYHE